jgi:hypothetical protein
MIYDPTFYLRELARQTEDKVQFKLLNFSDCKTFSSILEKNEIHISAHTLARLFGILKSKHRPYTSTLDLLANYMNYNTFSQFVKSVDENSKYALAHPNEAFATGDFSLTAFELALYNLDLETLKSLLDAYQPNEIDRLDFHNFVGSKVRHHPNRAELLAFLSSFESGKRNFYESFVDDDNPESYYSNALLQHYLKPESTFQEKLFVTCFSGTQNIYNQERIDLENIEVLFNMVGNIKSYPFQLVSRYFELRILLVGIQFKRTKNVSKLIEDVVEILPFYPFAQQNWIIGRSIKALAFTGNLESALSNPDFSSAVVDLNSKSEITVKSVGELFVQLTAHRFLQNDLKNDKFPRRMSFKVLNEEVDRVLTESLTAYIYSSEPVKNILQKNIQRSIKKKKHSWMNSFLSSS